MVVSIKDITGPMETIIISITIKELGAIRYFEKFGKDGKLQKGIAKDETGEIELVLWGKQADILKKGDTIKITNGIVTEWKDKLQLSSGKHGSIEILSRGKRNGK